MQQQQQRAPQQVHFPPPFARIHNPIHKPSWLPDPIHKQHKEEHKLAVDFSGTWIKDKAASESMCDAITLMGLSGIMRQAIKLIKGVQITQTDTSFTMAVFSLISWFKVSETYALNGSVSNCRRRDFRRGGHQGYVTTAAADQLQLHLKWNDPYGGEGLDTFSMPRPDVLYVDSSITVHDKTCKYRTVYNRKA